MNTSDNVYDSGLNGADWRSLHSALWPFIHAETPSDIQIPDVPEHLAGHPMLALLARYRSTGDDAALDQAGRILFPTDEPFGWYVVLTK